MAKTTKKWLENKSIWLMSDLVRTLYWIFGLKILYLQYLCDLC